MWRLVKANLSEANLSGADLSRANLSGVILAGTNLTGARQVMQSQLDRACGDETTNLPSALTIPLCKKVSSELRIRIRHAFRVKLRDLRGPGSGWRPAGAIQESRVIMEIPGEVGAVEQRLERIRSFEVRAGESCTGAISSPQVGARKIEPAQIEAAQAGPRQIRGLVVFRSPGNPCRSTASEHGEMFVIRHHLLPSDLRAALFRYCNMPDR